MKLISLLFFLLVLLTPATFTHAALPGADVLAELILGFDRNSDNRISRDEWAAGTADGFAEIDQNHDEQITEAEIAALRDPIAETHGNLAGATAPLLIKTLLMTLDQDGNKILSKAEYTVGALAVFIALDANKDGQLTKAELLELPARLLAPGAGK
jgi:hypothetical protein